MKPTMSAEYKTFFKEVKERIYKAQYDALKAVNKELINLYWNMRTFYLAYKESSKLQPKVAEISWTKNIIIMQRCKDDFQREFYLRMTKKFGWTKDVLTNQLEAGAFERYMANQTNFDKAVPEKYRHQAKLAVKDEYSFDFLELGEEHCINL